MMAPPGLHWRLLRLRRRQACAVAAVKRPQEGWLKVAADGGPGVVELVAEPSPGEALGVALEAALAGDVHRPGPRLLDWLAGLPDGPWPWDRRARRQLFELLAVGGPRSWRFLALTGVLDRALPELSQALARRQADPSELDPSHALRWPTLSRIQQMEEHRQLRHPESVLLAAVILDAVEDDTEPVPVALRMVERLGLGAAAERAVAGLVSDAGLLPAAARRLDSRDEDRVLQLAVHLGSAEQARALYLLTLAREALDPWEHRRLAELHDLVQAVVARPGVTGRDAGSLVEQHRAHAMRLSDEPRARERIAAAPHAYVLAGAAADLVRQAGMCEPPPGRDHVRVHVEWLDEGSWRVEVVAQDRIGLLAAAARALAESGLDVLGAVAVTWPDRCALQSFRVRAEAAPVQSALAQRLQSSLRQPLSSRPVGGFTLAFDNQASPWYTVCRVEAVDRRGLLHAITTAFAVCGASVHSARVATVDGVAVDLFELTDRRGHKLPNRLQEAVRASLERGATRRTGWFGRRASGGNGAGSGGKRAGRPKVMQSNQTGHHRETPAS